MNFYIELQIVDDPVPPDPIFFLEDPPCYEVVIESDQRDLPSYSDAVAAVSGDNLLMPVVDTRRCRSLGDVATKLSNIS